MKLSELISALQEAAREDGSDPEIWVQDNMCGCQECTWRTQRLEWRHGRWLIDG